MRKLVEPPSRSRCDQCGGELLIKVERTTSILDIAAEYVCGNCGKEHVFGRQSDAYVPDTKVA